MAGQPEGLVVTAAVWVAAATAAYLACSLVRARHAGAALAAAVLAVGAMAGGVASADSPRPRPPAGLSLDWVPAHQAVGHRPVVVRPGDCLWSITARELRDPVAARVAERWPGWWHANRRVIGPNPNLIRPGQRLRRPGPLSRRH